MPTASEVGAAPASHVNDKNNPHGVTIEQIGAAPAGYGLGEVKAKYVASPDDIVESGFYRSTAPNVTAGTAWYVCISYSENAKTVLGFNEASGGLAFMRTMKSGVWGEWEWVNPPMVPGVEYRTTERWDGQPVYTCLLNYGKAPNNDTGAVAHNLAVVRALRCFAHMNGNASVPYEAWGEKINASFNRTHIYVATSYNASAYDIYVQMWYTKS